MNIWEILGIAPTIDKKIIRRAYAEKTRKIHPEEKPEEFRQLHEAYQAALGYAEFVSKGNLPPGSLAAMPAAESAGEKAPEPPEAEESAETAAEVPADDSAGESDTEGTSADTAEEELLSYFAGSQEKQQQRIDAFLKYWTGLESVYKKPEVVEWWKTYLASEEFQEIRNHPQVLHILVEEMDHKLFFGIDEVKLLFWEAYGFREGEEEELQGDGKKLWKCLYPAYEKQQQKLESGRKVAKYEKAIRIFAGVAIVAIVVVCILAFVNVRRRREEGLQYLVNYMAEQYPDTSFSVPEQSEKLNDGSIVYGMHSSAHPELQITAKLEDTYVEGVRTFVVTEDYDKLLLEYYAVQYGLFSGRMIYTEGPYANTQETEYGLLLYEDFGQIDDFCERVEQMFHEQEELQKLSEIAVCTESVLFPEILLQGGVEFFPFAEPQIYDLRTMKAGELATLLRENHMIYMFQYESWNITPAQYREWGADYEKICEKWVDDQGEWQEVYDPETGEYLCRLFIPTYEYVDGSYDIGGMAMPSYKRAITVGNAYYYLLDRGADVSVNEDGSGFEVELYGNVTSFGRDPEEEFNQLRNCY